ncbi:MAG: Ger(x)C family spore germination C-terminal domain-containing protein, partial [Bacteroidota bacterium]
VTADSKIRALVRGNQIEFFIKIRASGFLVEVTTGKHNLNLTDIGLIREKTEKTIKKELVKTMARLQSLGSDVLGLGNILRATHPKIWRRINWEEEYPKVKVRVDFKFKVSRIGTFR